MHFITFYVIKDNIISTANLSLPCPLSISSLDFNIYAFLIVLTDSNLDFHTKNSKMHSDKLNSIFDTGDTSTYLNLYAFLEISFIYSDDQSRELLELE